MNNKVHKEILKHAASFTVLHLFLKQVCNVSSEMGHLFTQLLVRVRYI